MLQVKTVLKVTHSVHYRLEYFENKRLDSVGLRKCLFSALQLCQTYVWSTRAASVHVKARRRHQALDSNVKAQRIDQKVL